MCPRFSVALLALATAIAAGCAARPHSPAGSAPFHDTLVVPNKRIGAALLGMTTDQMVAWLGRPDSTVGSGDSAYRYTQAGLEIAFDKERAYIIAVNQPGFATADAIAVGSSAQQVAAAWGKSTSAHEVVRCVDRRCETTRVDTVQFCFANGMQADVDVARQTVSGLLVRAGGCQLP